jgi:nitrate/TMAO reductase-like tetraheme cytochrome c subunit
VLRRFFKSDREPGGKRPLWIVALLPGILIGILLLGGFNYAISYTNTLEFCISCHEMEDTVYQEYKTTLHYKNAAGVRAVCADCHVPHEWTATFTRKVKASNELFHKIIGTIDTPAKFEAKRLELAQHVWKTMKERDSIECRNCHSYEAMDFSEQDRHAARKMQRGIEEGKTCIDCHKGIAHELPEGYKEEKD